MKPQIPLDETARADRPDQDKARDDHTIEVTPDLAYQRLMLVNVVFFGNPGAGDGNWILIDTGIGGSSRRILQAVDERFGENARPAAIVLTHGHFDHVGNLEDLAERWDVPIYAHELEAPFLNGEASYPKPDPTVGGGAMSRLASFYPRGPVNVSRWLRILPSDGSVPGMPGWRWIHTPGHSPGHVSFWREGDRALIVGDAFITTRQESAYAVMTQEIEMHGPPMYYTQNWDKAEMSVKRLAELNPELVITGHGRAMQGEKMRTALQDLADEFQQVAVPKTGYYVEHPTLVENGTAYERKSS